MEIRVPFPLIFFLLQGQLKGKQHASPVIIAIVYGDVGVNISIEYKKYS